MVTIKHNQLMRRYEWLASLVYRRKYAVGAEIGCDRGDTTRFLLTMCPNLRLYAVDIWQRLTVKETRGVKPHKEYIYFDDPEYAIKQFNYRTEPFKDRLTILLGVSWDMAAQVPDNTLDFVFVDADHHYEPVKKDILAWTPKLKPGGLMCGHDIHINTVFKAVRELIPNHKRVGVDHCWEAYKEDVRI